MHVIERDTGHEPMPTDILKPTVEDLLREHLADPSVRVIDLESEAISGGGFSGNQVVRLHLAWTGAHGAGGSGAWILKQWLPGGHSERLLCIDRPQEALGWTDGLLRPESFPSGVSAPIIGAKVAPDERSAWILMEDVAADLRQYSRERPLLPPESVMRARAVLNQLARLHVWWEDPARQQRLRSSSWLAPMERFLWCEAASCAAVLRRDVPPGVAAGAMVTDDFRANVEALLAWTPAGDRAVFEELLYRRDPLVAALRPSSRTLLHGDLDDRNLGLRWMPPRHLPAHDGPVPPELVLIDWEWMAFGTPALDVARVWATFPSVCDQSQPCPEAAFSDELLLYYLERYQAHGGTMIDSRTWLRECRLSLVAHAMSQVNFIGSALRQDIKPIVSGMARQLDTILETVRSLAD